MTSELAFDHDFGPNFDQINYDMRDFVAGQYQENAPSEIRFKTWWTAFGTFCTQRPLDMLYMDQLTSTHMYPQVGSQPSMSFYMETRRILIKAQEEGLVKQQNISLMNQFVRVAVTNVVKINIAGGKTLTDEEIRWVVDACWDGIKS
ncbi:MAG TPA: hypothetical protein PLK63_07425 [Catalimonadaceae bacterium]|nr:hypothetical protein [Catalimonadaceae bacterium]